MGYDIIITYTRKCRYLKGDALAKIYLSCNYSVYRDYFNILDFEGKPVPIVINAINKALITLYKEEFSFSDFKSRNDGNPTKENFVYKLECIANTLRLYNLEKYSIYIIEI